MIPLPVAEIARITGGTVTGAAAGGALVTGRSAVSTASTAPGLCE